MLYIYALNIKVLFKLVDVNTEILCTSQYATAQLSLLWWGSKMQGI